MEDKLDHDERLRLECLAQAVASNTMRASSAALVLMDAADYEKFVRGERGHK